MEKKGMNMVQVKKQNCATILHCINKANAISRKDIALQTGLTAAAITLICNDLIQQGLLVEGEFVKKEAGSGAGRRKILVSIDYKAKYLVAIAIEFDGTTIAITDMKGSLVKKTHLQTEWYTTPIDFLDKIASCAKEMIASCSKVIKQKICFCGVSVPGLVDTEKGISLKAYGIWNEQVEVKKIMSEKLGMPVSVDNNVKCFAKSEMLYGFGKDADYVLFIKWGPGIGAASFHGNIGTSAELGHIIVEKNGKPCRCGKRGCLETLVSEAAFSNKTDDEKTKAIGMLAVTIVNLQTILNPDKIIIFGKLARDDKNFEKLLDFYKKYTLGSDRRDISYTKFSDCEDYIGAVAQAAETFIFYGN